MVSKLFHTYYCLLFCIFGFFFSSAQKQGNLSKIDTITLPKKAIDSLKLKTLDTIEKPEEALEAIVKHDAQDYIRQNVIDKTVTLYNSAVLNYKDINIKAG